MSAHHLTKYNMQNFTTFEPDVHFMFLLQVGLALEVGLHLTKLCYSEMYYEWYKTW
jgi:hypothetical protein